MVIWWCKINLSESTFSLQWSLLAPVTIDRIYSFSTYMAVWCQKLGHRWSWCGMVCHCPCISYKQFRRLLFSLGSSIEDIPSCLLLYAFDVTPPPPCGYL